MEANKIQEQDINLYCCYSLNLRRFLYKNGVRYRLAALNPNSKSLFWIYIKTDKLDQLLSQWSDNKESKQTVLITDNVQD